MDEKLDRRFRRWLSRLDHERAAKIYSAYTHLHPARRALSLTPAGEVVVAETDGERLVFPSPMPMKNWHHCANGYANWLPRKYTLPDFVEVAPGDVVVDCGAFVGGFSLGAARTAARIFAFEPAPANHACLLANVAGHAQVTPVQAGLFDRTGRVELNLSASVVDHSLLTPDRGGLGTCVTVQVYRLDDFLDSVGLKTVDFLKVEAEGVEPEVLAGLGTRVARKIAADCSAERNGVSPRPEIEPRLRALGYEIRSRGSMLFARLA